MRKSNHQKNRSPPVGSVVRQLNNSTAKVKPFKKKILFKLLNITPADIVLLPLLLFRNSKYNN